MASSISKSNSFVATFTEPALTFIFEVGPVANRILGRHATLLLAAALALTAVAAGPAAAASRRLAILPFRVAGDPDPALFDRARLPDFLQHATYFLFENRLRFPLDDRLGLNTTLDGLGYKPDQIFDHNRAGKICAGTGSTHLLLGSANFRAADALVVNIVSYSCANARIIAKARRSGRLAEMQRMLDDALGEACPFAQQLARPGGGPRRKSGLDLAVVLDTSGSMARDLPEIRKGLRAVSRFAPEGSRIGTVLLEDGDRIDVLPFTTHWDRMLRVLAAKKPTGNVGPRALERGLEKIEQYREQRGIPRLLVFSDAATGGDRLSLVESRLRRLRRTGWDLQLFNLSGQKPEDRGEWQRLSRTLGLKSPDVIYGRQAGFLEYSLFLVMIGSRFYSADQDLSGAIRADRLDRGDLKPIETVHYPSAALTLEDLPRYMAERENKKLTGLGPVVSGLETSIKKAALAGTTYEDVPYRALVKHEGRSFWVRLGKRSDFELLKAQRGETLYLGLRLSPTPGPEKITNLPEEIFVRKQQDVPRLLINSRDHLARIPERFVSPADVWFFLATILEVKDAGRAQDIRE